MNAIDPYFSQEEHKSPTHHARSWLLPEEHGIMHYDKNDPQAYNNEMGRYKTRKQLAFIREFLPHEGFRIVDIGGGNGRLAVPLADLGHKVTVVDESKLAMDLLSKEKHPNIECIHSDILSFKTPSPFDVAIAVDCIKHMTNIPITTLFSKIGHLLSPNGVFILVEINTGSWQYRFKRIIKRVCSYNIDSHSGYVSALREMRFEWMKSCGSNWMPFTFNSNSRLVNVFAILEHLLMLDRWPDQSPWVMIASRNTFTASASPPPALEVCGLQVPQDLREPEDFDVGPPPDLQALQSLRYDGR